MINSTMCGDRRAGLSTASDVALPVLRQYVRRRSPFPSDVPRALGSAYAHAPTNPARCGAKPTLIDRDAEESTCVPPSWKLASCTAKGAIRHGWSAVGRLQSCRRRKLDAIHVLAEVDVLFTRSIRLPNSIRQTLNVTRTLFCSTRFARCHLNCLLFAGTVSFTPGINVLCRRSKT